MIKLHLSRRGVVLRTVCAAGVLIACLLFGYLSWLAAQQNSEVLPPSPIRMELERRGNQVTISYPGSAWDYTVESADSLVPPIQWSKVTGNPVPNGDRMTVTLIETSASRFYRLRQTGEVTDPDHAAHH